MKNIFIKFKIPLYVLSICGVIFGLSIGKTETLVIFSIPSLAILLLTFLLNREGKENTPIINMTKKDSVVDELLKWTELRDKVKP